MNNNVVSLQIDTAGIMAMNRVDRIVLDPIRTYACTRTGVRVTPPTTYYEFCLHWLKASLLVLSHCANIFNNFMCLQNWIALCYMSAVFLPASTTYDFYSNRLNASLLFQHLYLPVKLKYICIELLYLNLSGKSHSLYQLPSNSVVEIELKRPSIEIKNKLF